MDPFLIFGNVVNRKVVWEGVSSLSPAQEKFAHNVGVELSRSMRKQPELSGSNFAYCMYNNSEDFMGSLMTVSADQLRQARADCQKLFDDRPVADEPSGDHPHSGEEYTVKELCNKFSKGGEAEIMMMWNMLSVGGQWIWPNADATLTKTARGFRFN